MPAVARVVLGRLLSGVLVVWAAATTAFVTLLLVPGAPVNAVLGPRSNASTEVRARVSAEYGFDDPIPVQYARFLGRLLRGDLGASYQLQRPVADVIGAELWPTCALALAAAGLTVLITVVVTVLTSGRSVWPRRLASLAELVLIATPTFWLGFLLLAVFSFRLGLFPVAGDGLAGLVLPAVTLALPMAAVLTQVTRDGLLAALEQPFATVVRARGLGETGLRLRHALRHAALPGLTLTGWFTGSLLGGAVLVENVFARPGIGRVTLQAVGNRDMPVVTGVVLLAATVFVLVNLLTDVAARALDPRLRAS